MAIGNPISLTDNVASKSVTIVATAGQTSFSPSGGYRINELAVYRNGVRLVDGRDFTARDGATVSLASACVVDDVVEFQIFDDFRVADAINQNDSDQTIDGNLNIVGVLSATTLKGDGTNITGVGTQGLNVQAQSITVAGVSTFADDVRVLAGGLDVVGVVTSNNKVVATGLDIGTAGVDIDG